MGTMASQITSLTIVYSTVYSGADQRIHQSSASLAFVWGIRRWLVNSPHKWFPFDDVIMICLISIFTIVSADGAGTSRTRFIKSLWAHNSKLIKIPVAMGRKVMIQSCHNYAHATTAQLLWHVQIWDLIGQSIHNYSKENFHKISVKGSLIICEICPWSASTWIRGPESYELYFCFIHIWYSGTSL